MSLSNQPFISICIPAYKQIEYLKRLLDSIVLQSYQHYEVIVSDDSPGSEVEELIKNYTHLPGLRYYKNNPALGMPANWNKALALAKGEWIKIMHDDDWFSNMDSLLIFSQRAEEAGDCIIFSGYTDVYTNNRKSKKSSFSSFRFNQVLNEPSSLLSKNIIGPPSTTMHRNNNSIVYDEKLKWLVDVDYYSQFLNSGKKLSYIPQSLINVGVGNEQVTASVHGNPDVEIPEHIYFQQKWGAHTVRNILVYDYWWRFIRNFSISETSLKKFGIVHSIPSVFYSMIKWQSIIPQFLLKLGIVSKFLMFIHFLIHRNRLK